MEIIPNLRHDINKPLYIQIYEYFKEEILNRKITAGTRLPSHRKLAEHLQVSRNTIELAYQQLLTEGYAESKPKKGLYAADVSYDVMKRKQESFCITAKQKIPAISYDFSQGHVDASVFPLTIWKRITTDCLYTNEERWFTAEDPQGEPELRSELCQYLYHSRGVVCSPDQIVFGAGTQYLLWLLIQLIGTDDEYAMENPGFHRVRAMLQSSSLSVSYIDLDEQGIHVASLQKTNAKTVYITPSHQFPYGMIMPLARRLELLQWANERNGYIIEDDYDGEFRYVGKPIPALQGLDTNERVIYFGTFSKAFLPSVRMSYMILPPALLKIYKERGTIYKQTVSKLHQLTMYHFMKDGHWHRHLSRIRTLYKKKQKALIAAIERYMGNHTEIIGSQSGLHIVLDVKNGMAEEQLIHTAAQYKVKVYPVSLYYADSSPFLSRILIGFGGLTEQEIEEAILLLNKAWFASEE
ncbi:PLP-dependent aminotransferase family protein [Ectobacillus panaciterrae]|uniref:MocR-like pyridoxine biosynthesis transcription factor PdxR n=1 Tax=Ectobacillus panaciterrae TaxID=363872 RepID=UPI000686EB06|nr:PLP-dependent aminotransferase family protein [Ectobacillus panaciterrae]